MVKTLIKLRFKPQNGDFTGNV